VLVGAAGNDGVDLIHFPSGFPEVIGVIATDHDDHRVGFSNYGMWCDLGAPGTWIFSTLPGDHFYPMGGTSMAAPHVSGGAAMLRSYEPRFDARDVRAILLQSCDDLGEPGFDEQYAFGRMNLERALKFHLTEDTAAPTLYWTGDPGFESDAIEPDEPSTRSPVEFRVTYADVDGDFPRVTELWLDLDHDGDFAPVERFQMAPVEPDELDFLAGKRYAVSLYLPADEGRPFVYRFHFEDARFAAVGPPADEQSVAVHVAPPRSAGGD
jgi:hypothetical protein